MGSINQKQVLVQMKRRTSANTWEADWQDLTPWFIGRESDVAVQLDDQTLQGRLEQQSVTLRFNNTTGKFNPDGSSTSLWDGSTTYSYHSRIRYYEWNLAQKPATGATEYRPVAMTYAGEPARHYYQVTAHPSGNAIYYLSYGQTPYTEGVATLSTVYGSSNPLYDGLQTITKSSTFYISDKTAVGTSAGYFNKALSPTTVTVLEHGFSEGDSIWITGTENYNGFYQISGVTADTFNINAAFVADETTSMVITTAKGLPLIDGLLAEGPKYFTQHDSTIVVNSMLDVLRGHFILENTSSRVSGVTSTSIMKYIMDLYNGTYPELGVTTTGGVFRNVIVYDKLDLYSRTVYELMTSIISDGGGIGGLTRDKRLFFTFFENQKTNSAAFLEMGGNTVGLYGIHTVSGATVPNESTNSGALNAITLGGAFYYRDGYLTNTTSAAGYFPSSYAIRHGSIASAGTVPSFTSYEVHMLLKSETNYGLTTTTRAYYGGSDVIQGHIFSWSSDTLLTNTYYEGFVLRNGEDIYYVCKDATHNVAVQLGTVLKDKTWYLLSLTVNQLSNSVAMAIDGKLSATASLAGGIVNAVTKNYANICQAQAVTYAWGSTVQLPAGNMDNFWCGGLKLDANTEFYSFANNAYGNASRLVGSSFII